jgi:hypothetical protein
MKTAEEYKLKVMRGSDEAFRTMIAREIWAFNECPWDFDNPPAGMAGLQKELAVNQAERIRAKIFGSELMRAYVIHHGMEQMIPVGALNDARDQFAQETRRTSEYYRLTERIMVKLADMGHRADALPPCQHCDICKWLIDAKELMSRPINAPPSND